MHCGFACLILTCEHFSDLSRTGRLSTSLILQFAGWNSRPCLSLPPPSNENPRSTSYWPTTWLIKTCLESRCQLTVKPIKPNSAPHTEQSLPPWQWILCFIKGLNTIFFSYHSECCALIMVNATFSNSTCRISHYLNQCTYLNVSNGLCCSTWKSSNFCRSGCQLLVLMLHCLPFTLLKHICENTVTIKMFTNYGIWFRWSS